LEEKMKKLSLLLVLSLVLFSFVGCSSEKPAGGNAGETKTLTGTAKGFGGDVTVTLTVNGNDITEVKAVGASETQGIGSKAIEELPAAIEKADSADVDGVSGATVTSNAIKEAVKNALAGK